MKNIERGFACIFAGLAVKLAFQERCEKLYFLSESSRRSYFFLIEVYYSVEDQLKLRETDHYINWKKNILQLLEKPYEINELKIYS